MISIQMRIWKIKDIVEQGIYYGISFVDARNITPTGFTLEVNSEEDRDTTLLHLNHMRAALTEAGHGEKIGICFNLI